MLLFSITRLIKISKNHNTSVSILLQQYKEIQSQKSGKKRNNLDLLAVMTNTNHRSFTINMYSGKEISQDHKTLKIYKNYLKYLKLISLKRKQKIFCILKWFKIYFCMANIQKVNEEKIGHTLSIQNMLVPNQEVCIQWFVLQIANTDIVTHFLPLLLT